MRIEGRKVMEVQLWISYCFVSDLVLCSSFTFNARLFVIFHAHYIGLLRFGYLLLDLFTIPLVNLTILWFLHSAFVRK